MFMYSIFAEAEVREFDVSVVVQQHVVRLEVAMYIVQLVHALHG